MLHKVCSENINDFAKVLTSTPIVENENRQLPEDKRFISYPDDASSSSEEASAKSGQFIDSHELSEIHTYLEENKEAWSVSNEMIEREIKQERQL